MCKRFSRLELTRIRLALCLKFAVAATLVLGSCAVPTYAQEAAPDAPSTETSTESPSDQAAAEKPPAVEPTEPSPAIGDKPEKAKKKAAEAKPAVDPEPKKLPKLGSATGPMLPGQPWRVHDLRRPRPGMIVPGELTTYDKPGTAPSDAVVLFDGTDLSNWCHVSKEDPNLLLAAQWKVADGYFEVSPKTGPLQTIDSFGSCQLHIEWQTPAEVKGDSQGRGNSGVFFMEEFEVQVLDSYDNRTYADGQAGALYGQYPPLVNASRKPGQWQVYDIIFIAPKFSLEGKLEKPALVTVIHNGVLLHHAREYYGPTGGGVVPKYNSLTPAAPIALQDHGNPVRYRNVWIRGITE